jgi:membrane fusion protein, heavy metal efflux system
VSDARRSVPWPLLAAGGAGLLAIGVGVGYSLRPAAVASTPAAAIAINETAGNTAAHGHGAHAPTAGHASDPADVLTLTPDMVTRAGIRTAMATAGTATTSLRMPGVVQANAYKEVMVTSLVSGRVMQVGALLGQRVNRGDSIATVYSPELADAQTAFIVARADQVAHGQRQTRTQRLTAIGAATREELETLEAERAMHDAAVERARARLILLGIPEERTQRLAGPQDVTTSFDVRAPLDGVVTQRTANPGVNVDPATPLFTIVDLSTVWVIADLYERDFARVRNGSAVAITTAAYPGLTLPGRVSYIDPQIQPETRTAKLRIEVPNRAGQLRLGMYVDVNVGESALEAVFVPRAAVQAVGAELVVYVADRDHPGRFSERKVELGNQVGDRVAVLAGIAQGDVVVTDGGSYLRAERERLRRGAP